MIKINLMSFRMNSFSYYRKFQIFTFLAETTQAFYQCNFLLPYLFLYQHLSFFKEQDLSWDTSGISFLIHGLIYDLDSGLSL
jgi:hypothetical protein